MKFPYKWYLKDGYPAKGVEKHNSKVFSCFAGGGGSSMGYKLAGYDVLGCNEIDKKMMECYKANHNPKYSYLEPIQEFKNRNDLPEELYNLDILDGSPPCSSFSIVGNREKDWGKEKKFREGQENQVLDTLFFDFIELAGKLKPKIIIAENVKGLLLGNARKYMTKIYKKIEKIGYSHHHWLLSASKMGVPQRRERVFIIAMRNDLCDKFENKIAMFNQLPELDLMFNEKEIPFKEIEDNKNIKEITHTIGSKLWIKCKNGEGFAKYHPKGSFFNNSKADPNKVINTLTADPSQGTWHYNIQRLLDKDELCSAGTFPQDYNFIEQKPKYVIGMSVPPVMIAQIANRIYEQWIKEL